MRKLIINGIYKHYKGNKYRVLNVAKHSETLEDLVVYQALYGEQNIWARPLDMFLENICRDGKTFERFSYVTPEVETRLTIELDEGIKEYLYENGIDLLYELRKEYPQITHEADFTEEGAKDVGLIIVCSGIAASLVILAINKLMETIIYRPHYVVVEELDENGNVSNRHTELLQPDAPKNNLIIGAEIDSPKVKVTIEDRKE